MGSETTLQMRHLAFFSELAALEDSDPAWRSVTAGLVVIRLVDAWVEEGAAVVSADSWGVRSVRAAIDDMPAGMPARTILGGVVDALTSSQGGDLHAVAPRLLAYARSLDLDARWGMAADVYECVIAHVHPIEDADASVSAHMRLSYCRRQLGELDEAERVAVRAGQVASLAGDVTGTLQARIAEAKVAIARGNYPRAESMLDETIAAARDACLHTFRAHATQERADVAFLKGEYELAVKLGYDALAGLTEERARDRMMNDIAGAFYKLGVRSTATDVYGLLSVTASEQIVRWAASINLMEIAAEDGSLPLFERQRRELDRADMPPLLRTQYLMHAGTGLNRLGDPDGARRLLSSAIDLATAHGFNRLVFEGEAQLTSLATPQQAGSVERQVPFELEPIADAFKQMRRELVTA